MNLLANHFHQRSNKTNGVYCRWSHWYATFQPLEKIYLTYYDYYLTATLNSK